MCQNDNKMTSKDSSLTEYHQYANALVDPSVSKYLFVKEWKAVYLLNVIYILHSRLMSLFQKITKKLL